MTQLNQLEAGGSTGLRRDITSDKKTSKWTSKGHFLTSCQKFKKIHKKFLQEKASLKKSNTKESCPEFDIKVGKVNFNLAQ
jgi:hypothetical protein